MVRRLTKVGRNSGLVTGDGEAVALRLEETPYIFCHL